MKTFIFLAFITQNFLNAASSDILQVGNRRVKKQRTNYLYNSNQLDSSHINRLLETYLLPGHKKISISNWLHPSENDYFALQNYLSFSTRPELIFLDFPNTTYRSERIRNMKLITSDHKPVFEIVKINSTNEEKKTA